MTLAASFRIVMCHFNRRDTRTDKKEREKRRKNRNILFNWRTQCTHEHKPFRRAQMPWIMWTMTGWTAIRWIGTTKEEKNSIEIPGKSVARKRERAQRISQRRFERFRIFVVGIVAQNVRVLHARFFVLCRNGAIDQIVSVSIRIETNVLYRLNKFHSSIPLRQSKCTQNNSWLQSNDWKFCTRFISAFCAVVYCVRSWTAYTWTHSFGELKELLVISIEKKCVFLEISVWILFFNLFSLKIIMGKDPVGNAYE